MNLTRFSIAKYKVLHLDYSNPKYAYRLGERLEISPAEKDLGVLMDEKLNVSQQSAFAAQKPMVSWAPSEKGWLAGTGR